VLLAQSVGKADVLGALTFELGGSQASDGARDAR
jgi:hypothetical protein